MNQINIIGNLVRDVEIKTLQSGKILGSMTIAVNRKFKDQNGEKACDFFKCTLWGKTAEISGQYLTKGSKCLVTGEMQLRQYTDKDGNNRISPEINVDNVEFLPSAQAQQHDTFSPQITIEETDLSDLGDDLPF